MQTGYTSGPDLQKNMLSVNTDINPFHKLSINNSKIFRPHCQKNGSVSIVPIILCHVRLHGDVEFVFFHIRNSYFTMSCMALDNSTKASSTAAKDTHFRLRHSY